MCFDIAVTKMWAESKQRDTEDPGESNTQAWKKVERKRLKTTEEAEGQLDR